ncbi:hypothetical protein [Streptomyces sp. NPDC048845]|uniref:hypothetical protein n=1 Tax=Streptomyces sp. NPDC048845 TaxID=3155390 RepID=UPI003449E6A7
MPDKHGRVCVIRWRQVADSEQWSLSRLVSEVQRCCSVSRLRAHRLVRGWTLAQAVHEFRDLCVAHQLACPRLDPDQLRVWETRRDRRPQRTTIDLLCRLYRTNARDLALEPAGDYSAADSTSTPDARPIGALHTRPAPTAATPTALPTDPLEAIRHTVDRTLASASVTSGQLDLMEERLLLHRQQYIVSPPQQMLTELAADLGEVQLLAAERQPASAQLRLSEMTAILSTLVADALMKLGRLRQAGAWYATARTAADDSGRPDLRARVRVQAAMLPYYYGPLENAVRLAHEARLLTQNRPTETAAFAAAAEARARARIGDAAGAEAAMSMAQNLFARTRHPASGIRHPSSGDDAWAFPERRLLLYLSGTLTSMALPRRAREKQQQAHTLYLTRPGTIDPTLLRLDEAICLVHERHMDDACQLARCTHMGVPPEHRTRILEARARNVIETAPEPLRKSRSARELDDCLTLPPGQG